MLRNLLAFTLVISCSRAALAEGEASKPIDFMRDIRPILAQNCFMCHGPDEATLEASLRLDTREGAVSEAASGMQAIVPGQAEASELMVRVKSDEDYMMMPPPESGRELTHKQIELLGAWIDGGAEYAQHWSFQSLVTQPLPEVTDQSWPRNEIDDFILARLESLEVKPSPEAGRETLIRRLSIDLTGLPPTPSEVDRFTNDLSPTAYERLVDRLLESPRFGERWGRHWLDLARYADSNGYLGDELRPQAWKYRDWVIDAINADMPFDQFTIEQLAGDLLTDATPQQRVATGFHRNSMKNTEAGADRELDRTIRAVDRTSTTGTVWLGLTLGCAECHTHKFDPITHAEFYSMYAFFNNVDDYDLPVVQSEVRVAYEKALAAWRREVTDVKLSIQEVIDRLNRNRDDEKPYQRDQLLLTLRTAESNRERADKELLDEFFLQIEASEKPLFERYQHLASTMPKVSKETAPTIRTSPEPRDTYVHLRGSYKNRGAKVEPGTLSVLHPFEPRNETADRLDLARWIVDPANPLTPRTAVNHIWKHLFGRGIVRTTDDFGTTGDAPTHPELLDWLAITFRDSGWSRKQLVKRIVMSATYRQSSDMRADLLQIDAMNELLARQSRFRLEAEIIRDLALFASGLLEPKIGGPSVRPYMNTEITEISRNQDWKVSAGSDKYRRGMYILFRRATPYPMLTTFDAPDTTVSCTRRERGNSPLQALTLLNDPVFVECAQHLGKRLVQRAESTPTERVTSAFRLCLGRLPSAEELERVLSFVAEQRKMLDTLDQKQLQEIVGEPFPDVTLVQQAECVALARVLMNLDEFITRQ